MPHMAPVVAASLIAGGTGLASVGIGAHSQSKAAKTQAQADALALEEARRRQDIEDTRYEDETRYARNEKGRDDYVSREGAYRSAQNRSPIVNEFFDRMGYARPEVLNLNDIAGGYKPSAYTPPPRPQYYGTPPLPSSGGGHGTRNTLLALGLGGLGAAAGGYWNSRGKVPVQLPPPQPGNLYAG